MRISKKYSSIEYDGQAVTATLSFEYCDSDAKMIAALYQNGQMLAVSGASVTTGTEKTAITLPVSDLLGTYELKTFMVDAAGIWQPMCEAQDISFYAN